MQTLGPVAAPESVVLTIHGAASDDKVGSTTIPRALNEARLGNSMTCIVVTVATGSF